MPTKSQKAKPQVYRYGNELDEPLDWRANALLHSYGAGARGEPDWQLRFELVRRFDLLFAHWGISKEAPDAYQQLAAHLAFNHVVGLSMVPPDKKRRGNPGKDWRYQIFSAVEDVRRKQSDAKRDATTASVLSICRYLSKNLRHFIGEKPTTMERAYKKEKKKREDFEKAKARMQELMKPKSNDSPLAKALMGSSWGSWG
jgi:hypothetical protein